jgi:hypothetical protein
MEIGGMNKPVSRLFAQDSFWFGGYFYPLRTGAF